MSVSPLQCASRVCHTASLSNRLLHCASVALCVTLYFCLPCYNVCLVSVTLNLCLPARYTVPPSPYVLDRMSVYPVTIYLMSVKLYASVSMSVTLCLSSPCYSVLLFPCVSHLVSVSLLQCVPVSLSVTLSFCLPGCYTLSLSPCLLQCISVSLSVTLSASLCYTLCQSPCLLQYTFVSLSVTLSPYLLNHVYVSLSVTLSF